MEEAKSHLKEHIWEAKASAEAGGESTFQSILDPNAANVCVFYLPEVDQYWRDMLVHPSGLEIAKSILGALHATADKLVGEAVERASRDAEPGDETAASAESHRRQRRNLFTLRDVDWLEQCCFQGRPMLLTGVLLATALEAARDVADQHQAETIELLDVTIVVFVVLETLLSSIEIEALTSLRSPPDSSDDTPTPHADFSLHIRASNTTKTIATGRLCIKQQLLHCRQPKPPSLVSVNISQFYDSLDDQLQRVFQSPYFRKETPGLCTLLLASAAPRDGSLWTAFTPKRINRMILYHRSSRVTPNIIEIDARVLELAPGRGADLPVIKGDVDIYIPGNQSPHLRIEGLEISPAERATAEKDKLLYLATAWKHDILSGIVRTWDDNDGENGARRRISKRL
ncbi:hypothetical protein F4680DRAFT_468220 [Xylaria scruposa]|nr:hypothetical protein F4680DRAFT_468220 [Xylaria scruposa]